MTDRHLTEALVESALGAFLFYALLAASHGLVPSEERFQRARLLGGFALPVIVGNLVAGTLFTRWGWEGEAFRSLRVGYALCWVLLYAAFAMGCLGWVAWLREEFGTPSRREVSRRWIVLAWRLGFGVAISGVFGFFAFLWGQPIHWEVLALIALLCACFDKVALFFIAILARGF